VTGTSGDRGQALYASAMPAPGPPLPCVPATLLRGDGTWRWVVLRCPFCSRRHSHGGGLLAESPFRYLGSRISHCTTWESHSYILVARPDALDILRRYRRTEAARVCAERAACGRGAI
jgi:hypothetical protein